MSDNLQRAIAAIRSGDKETGQRLLAELIVSDPRNEAAWLWMSAVIDSDEHRRACLERVLAINPNNKAARGGLEMLRQKQAPRQADQQSMPLLATAADALQQSAPAISESAAAQPVRPISATEIKPESLDRVTVENKSYQSPLKGKIRALIIPGIILIVLLVLWIVFVLRSASLLRNINSQ